MRFTVNTLATGFRNLKNELFLIVLIAFLFSGCVNNTAKKEFSFVFMTDIHVQPELKADVGLSQAIAKVNELNPDFVITGGDQIMDALQHSYSRSDSLYNIYYTLSQKFAVPVYNTLGNHEVFGLYEKSGIFPDHPEFGKKMFKNRMKYEKTYYSFNHKNWHFMILDGIGYTDDRNYYGHVDSVQMEWIKEDLKTLDKKTPIVISIHIPMISMSAQISGGSKETMGAHAIENAPEVLQLFKDHNLKIVLQGHLHIVEEMIFRGTHFITGGAVCARWWTGPLQGFEEGFVLLKLDENSDDFSWEYIDYGWDAVK